MSTPYAEIRLKLWGEVKFDHTLHGCVYFAECMIDKGDASHNPIKIGMCAETWSLPQRIKALQTSNPFELKYAGFIPGGGPKLEMYLHLQFDHLRMRGEWFLPGKDLLKMIEEANKINAELGWTPEYGWSA